MQLHVAMVKCRTRIVGDQVNFNALAPGHVNGVFKNSRRRFSCDPGQLKCVAMKMNRMVVTATIVQRDSIALSFFHP